MAHKANAIEGNSILELRCVAKKIVNESTKLKTEERKKETQHKANSDKERKK